MKFVRTRILCFGYCYIRNVYTSICLYSTHFINIGLVNEFESWRYSIFMTSENNQLVPISSFTQFRKYLINFHLENTACWMVNEFYLLSYKNPKPLQFYSKDTALSLFQEKVCQTWCYSYLIFYYLFSEPLRFQPLS